MNLTDLKINEFVDLMSSDAPAPGGGSASALAGAVGIALTCMVSELTIGKVKYKEHEPLMIEILESAKQLKNNLLSSIDEDTAAFNKVTDVFKMPKATDEDKALRTSAMQEALKYATKVPYQIMVYAHEALSLTERAVGKSNTNAASDLGVAALNLKSAIQGAWLNVLINLASIKDEEFVAQYKSDGKILLSEAVPTADGIYSKVLKSL